MKNINLEVFEKELITFGRRVTVVPEAVQKETRNGLVLPESAQKNAGIGVVVSVGDEVPSDSRIKPGMMVFYHRDAGTQLKFNDQDILTLRYDDLFHGYLIEGGDHE